MPSAKLTDRLLASLKPPSRGQVDYFDRVLPGFGLRVGATGRKTFVLMHRVNGHLQRLTLRDPETGVATYPVLGLSVARDLARAALRSVADGRDPGAEAKQARTQTFGALSDLYLEQHAKRKKKTWRTDASMIRSHLRDWAERPVTAIRRSDVRDLLEALVTRGAPVTANRVLALVRKILNFGLDREWVAANVAARMPRPAAEKARSRVLSADELRTVWQWLSKPVPEAEDAQHWRLTQAWLKLRLVTAQRGGEVLQMRWADLDLEGHWWIIPAEHSKNNLAHRVPLTPTALRILRDLQKQATSTERVFSGIRSARHRPAVRDGLPVVDVRPHDFRRTAATMMASGGVPRLVIAKILNHVDSTITAVYDRASYNAEKRVGLETWERMLLAAVKKQKSSARVRPFARDRVS